MPSELQLVSLPAGRQVFSPKSSFAGSGELLFMQL